MRWIVVGAVIAATSTAHADDEARPTRVQVALHGPRAELRLSQRIAFTGRSIRVVRVDLPPGGVVTSATVAARGQAPHRLDLVAAGDAERRTSALEDTPRSRDMAWAAAVSADEGWGLWITAMAPRRTALDVELVIEAPTCYLDDRRHVQVPSDWARLLDRRIVVQNEGRAARIDERCGRRDDTTWLALPTTELAARPPGDDRIGATAVRFAHGDRQAARVELALARTLAAVPADLATVFVVDGSASVEPERARTQRAVIASYLRHAPASAVQVIVYDRAARALLPAWQPGRAAASSIDKALAALEPRNGSDVDRGVAAAARWLQRRSGTRRVVVFTDERLPDRIARLQPERIAGLLPPGTLVHVVALDDGDTSLTRDDDARLARVAAVRLGMAVRAMGGGRELDALSLVRPTALHGVTIAAPGFDRFDGDEAVACTEIDLREGQACSWWATGPARPDSIEVTGRIWGRAWRKVIPLGDRESVTGARELSQAVPEDAEPALVAAADAAARVVNKHWSLFTQWGGGGGYKNPQTEDTALYGGVCGCDGGDIRGGFGSSGATARIVEPTVRTQVERAIAGCRRDGATIEIKLELTRQEIAGVTATVTGVADAAPIRACAEAAVWDLPLLLAPAPDHQYITLKL